MLSVEPPIPFKPSFVFIDLSLFQLLQARDKLVLDDLRNLTQEELVDLQRTYDPLLKGLHHLAQLCLVPDVRGTGTLRDLFVGILQREFLDSGI